MKAHHAALCAGAIIAALVFFVAGAVIRLLVGPVSLGPLAGTLDQAIQAALPGITLRYDKAAVEWDRDDSRFDLVVLGARVLDQDGHTVIGAPKAAIDLAAPPLLRGKVAVQRITLVGVSFKLIHMKDGGIRLGAEGDKVNDVLARLEDVIEAKGGSTSSLRSFAVRDAHMTLHDEATGLDLKAPRAGLSVTARGKALGTVFNADVTVGRGSAHVAADLTLPENSGPVAGSASISGLDIGALGAAAPAFGVLKGMGLVADLSARFSMAPGGRLTRADFDADATGEIPFAFGRMKALHVRHLRLTGLYDGVQGRLALGAVTLDAREAQLRLRGDADFRRDAKGMLAAIATRLAVSRAAFAMPGVLAGPVALQSATLDGVWHPAAGNFTVQRLAVSAPSFLLDAKGTVTPGKAGEAPGVEMTGTLAGADVRTLLHYWPLPVVPGARSWIAENVFAGTVGPFAFETHFAPGMMDWPVLPDDALKLSFPMSGIEAAYLPGLTHVTGVTGTGTLTGDSFTADFGSGKVGNLAVSNGHAAIPALHLHGTVGEFTAHVDGALPDIMTLIDMPPLGYPTRFGIDPRQTAGHAGVDLDFKVPMLAKVKVDDVGIDVEADATGFAVALGKIHLGNGDVHFSITNTSLHQTGSLNLADSRLAVDWQEDFATSAPVTGHVAVKGQLTDAGRAALNIGLARILTGPVGVDATLAAHRGHLISAEADVDLTPAAILMPFVNLGKPAGQPASGHVSVTFGPGDQVASETMQFSGPGLSANGSASFDGQGGLARVDFPSVKMGALNDLSFTMVHAPAGDTYTVRGHSLDGSLIGRNPNATPGGPGVNASVPPHGDTLTGNFHIDARLDRFAMRDGVFIAPFAMDVSGQGERLAALNLSGTIGQGPAAQGKPITALLENTPEGRKVTVRAGDAGALIRGLFAFESLRGGTLDLTATLPGPAAGTTPAGVPDYQGKLDIDDFSMVNQPLLTRLFSAGSLTGLGDLMGGNGITLDNLDVPFSSKNSVVSIKGAAARGPAVGATADGYIDRPHNQVALKGSLVPAYGLNSVLGNVPILGDILVSKKGEGVFGVTYSATGNADQPDISVNPLSVLTPGILRRIFEGSMPNAANAPTNAQAKHDAPPAPAPRPQ